MVQAEQAKCGGALVPQQERAIRTRKVILAAAAEVFDEVGYEAATISEILKRSGLTKGALYFHFGSKLELAQGVLAEQVAMLPSVPEHQLKLQMSVDEALLLAYLLTGESAAKDPGNAIVRGSVRLTLEQGGACDGLDRKVPLQGWIDRTLKLFEEAAANGELLPHVDLVGVVKLLVGAFTGVQVLSNTMTRRADLLDRVADLYRHLMPAIAVAGVLMRLDFSPQRGEQAYETAMRLRRERAESGSAG